MKPSERRALEAEKRAQKEAEARERELQKAIREAEKQSHKIQNDQDESGAPDLGGINREDTYEKLSKRNTKAKVDGYHRESFWSNHSRLIAFIITTVVVLFVVGPLGYDIYLNVRDAQSQGNKVEGKPMTVEDVYYIAENADAIKWSSFEKFNYTDYGGEREFAIEGTSLTLRVGKSQSSAYPEYIRLIDYTSGDFIKDVRKASSYEINEFIEKHAK